METRHPAATQAATAIKSLEKSKAPGNDDVQPELFKYGGDQLIAILEKLLKGDWDEKKIPEQMKTADKVPSSKKVM